MSAVIDPGATSPRRRRGWLLALGALALVAVAGALLLTADPDGSLDERGDVRVIEGAPGRDPRRAGELAASSADIVAAWVRSADGELVFEAAFAVEPPARLHPAALELRWELQGDDGSRWTLSAVLSRKLHAALVSESGYGSGTIDGSLRGDVRIAGDAIAIRLRAGEIPGFPEGFEWRLSSLLRAFADEPDSPRVQDEMPDEGFRSFKG